MAAPSFRTPLHGHVGRGAFSNVYEPAEDTFLLLDALEAAAAELTGCEEGEGLRGRGLGRPGEAAAKGEPRKGGMLSAPRGVEICLEVGSGSGVVSAFLASMIGPQALYMCTDINPEAAACTLETAHCNKVHIQPVITDLVKGLLPRLKEKVDLLVFNPPYVVTPPEELQHLGGEKFCHQLPAQPRALLRHIQESQAMARMLTTEPLGDRTQAVKQFLQHF
ncbi:methyltransferase N6AMT1 isoform X5 [Ursus maritimus]|uniref:Methyltransferase HEMK2 n=1 Tax=Ursus maritimus TaxID=29073 RepID=A0A8M1F4G8_URSMA|nr:methyltransferase N6AMT1 isoform X5 [Ursus maritimus]